MIEIVRAQEHHIPAIGDLWWEFMKFSESVDVIYEPKAHSIPIFQNDYLRPAMNDSNSLVLVALEEEHVVGYSYSYLVAESALQTRPQYGHIHDMFVATDARRQGIGEKMIEEIYFWFRSHKVQRVELDIAFGNIIADSFWRKAGFSDVQTTVYRTI